MKYPLYKVTRSSNTNVNMQVIAPNQTEALARAVEVWAAKGMEPVGERENVNILFAGTVDYIPAMKAAHVEGK